MLNEHHGTPFCLGAVMDVEASIVAKTTKRVKIALPGQSRTTSVQRATLGGRTRHDRLDLQWAHDHRLGAWCRALNNPPSNANPAS